MIKLSEKEEKVIIEFMEVVLSQEKNYKRACEQLNPYLSDTGKVLVCETLNSLVMMARLILNRES